MSSFSLVKGRMEMMASLGAMVTVVVQELSDVETTRVEKKRKKDRTWHAVHIANAMGHGYEKDSSMAFSLVE